MATTTTKTTTNQLAKWNGITYFRSLVNNSLYLIQLEIMTVVIFGLEPGIVEPWTFCNNYDLRWRIQQQQQQKMRKKTIREWEKKNPKDKIPTKPTRI